MPFKLALSAAAATLCLASAATAAPFTFFGENTSPGATVTGDPVTARANFLATLSGGVGTETFDSLSEGTSNPALSFPGSTGNITATLNGSGSVTDFGGSAGRFPTSGGNWYETGGGGDFSISFSSGISAFGFYGTDIGDIGNSLTLRMTKVSDGTTVDVAVGNSTGSSINGSLLFFGFVDTDEAYSSIQFINAPGGGDVFGFDDMTVGDVTQIVNPPSGEVPLPAGGVLLLSALGGAAFLRRKKS
jgi:hypothetical protein